jgi:hypothetical protein
LVSEYSFLLRSKFSLGLALGHLEYVHGSKRRMPQSINKSNHKTKVHTIRFFYC